MALPLKIPLLAVGATAALGVGALVIKGFPVSQNEESIASLLSEDLSKRSIADNETTYGTDKWTAYKSSKKDIWKLGNAEQVPVAFKTTCKNKLDSKVSGKNSQEYKDFLDYCTRATLVSDLIVENASTKELLAKKTGTDGDGVASWKLYVDDERNKKQQDGDGIWKLGNWNEKHSVLTSAPETFMDKCVANAKEPFYDVTGSLYLDTLKFCTKNKAMANIVPNG